MTKLKKIDADRYLITRGNRYVYKRRVPALVADLDSRSPMVQIALRTNDLVKARFKRDLLEQADNEYWSALMLDSDANGAKNKYKAAVKRAEAFGFSYNSAIDLAQAPLNDIVSRFETILAHPKDKKLEEALLGIEGVPETTLSQAENIYFQEIVPHQLKQKSEKQKKHWIDERKKTFSFLRKNIGDKNILDVTRDDALLIYRTLNAAVLETGTNEARSASWGNRHLGNIRMFFNAYFSYISKNDQINPFAGLSFKEFKTSRPPFSLPWIKNTILRKGALSSLNDEARHILLTLIDTGARMGEICNLDADNIHLTGEVPYIEIKPRTDPNNPREIKTKSSIRKIPLIGLAYEAIKRNPDGFHRYRDKETTLSNTLNKYFRENGLFETEKHVIYSFRHSFEDRMKEANIDHELRMSLMGHTIDRPKYGSGGHLKWQCEQLKKIEFQFDDAIL